MRFPIISFVIMLAFSSCTAVKLSVPEQFSSQATKMNVKGLQGWQINQQLSFGPFQTSKIKRGWDFTSGMQHTKFNLKPEEMMLKVLNVDVDKRNINHKGKFQYSIDDGNLVADVYAMERFSEK